MYDFQKANMWKRISASVLDFFLLVVAVVGIALPLSSVLKYESYSDRLQACYDRYEAEYGISFDISADEYNAFSEEELARYVEATEAFAADAEANHLATMMINLTLIIITFSLLFGFLVFEFVVPLIFRNGQTLGKKVFGIGVMREDGVKLTPMLLFIRTVLGKFTVETMIPVMILIMLYFNLMGVFGFAVLLAIIIVQLALLIWTKARTPIHDKLAHTVTMDLSSQMIFDSSEELLAYKQRIHAEAVENTES